MQNFVVEITYAAPIEQIESILDEHRAFLQVGYDKGLLLMSGPQVPRTGGIVIARANSMEELAEFFSNDPYNKNGFADYQYIQFNPVKHNEIIDDWIK